MKEREEALKQMEEARRRLKDAPAGLQGAGAEKAYAEAYQRLVKLGLAQQLRRKYRP